MKNVMSLILSLSLSLIYSCDGTNNSSRYESLIKISSSDGFKPYEGNPIIAVGPEGSFDSGAILLGTFDSGRQIAGRKFVFSRSPLGRGAATDRQKVIPRLEKPLRTATMEADAENVEKDVFASNAKAARLW